MTAFRGGADRLEAFLSVHRQRGALRMDAAKHLFGFLRRDLVTREVPDVFVVPLKAPITHNSSIHK